MRGGHLFASADALVDWLVKLYHQADRKLHTVGLDLEGANFVDSQEADALAEIIELSAGRDIELRLAWVKTAVKDLFQRDGIMDRLGVSRIYGNVYEAAADRIPDGPVLLAGLD